MEKTYTSFGIKGFHDVLALDRFLSHYEETNCGDAIQTRVLLTNDSDASRFLSWIG